MRFNEINKMQKEELDKKLYELKTELMKLNAQVSTGTTLKSTKQIRDIKRNLAKVETLRSQKAQNQIKEVKKKYIHS